MRPAPFTLHRPRSIREAVNLTEKGGVPLAGGQALLQDLRQRNFSPAEIVNLSNVTDLSETIRSDKDFFHIGARVTVRTLLEDKDIAQYSPWLTEAARKLGDVQVRNFATVMGNVCWSDPRANLAVALLASGAKILLFSNKYGAETVGLGDFFTGFRKNVTRNRIATCIELPIKPKRHGTYLEFSRQNQDLALVNLTVITDGQSIILGIGGIHKRPICLRVEKDTPSEKIIDRIKILEDQLLNDQFASLEHKLEILDTLLSKARKELCI